MTRIVETEMTRGGIENWKLVGDQVIALNGALSGEAGIALIAGTGSICFGKNGAEMCIRDRRRTAWVTCTSATGASTDPSQHSQELTE